MMRLLFACVVVMGIQTAKASTTEDQIRSMAGCYQVTFEFMETFDRLPNYPIHSKKYFEQSFELVVVDKDTDGEIHLQHVLPTVMGPVKHWRQEWIKESKTLWDYKSGLHWTRSDVTPAPGAWLQRITQVDDSPRYECQANWVTTGQKSFWECDGPAPLPRREYSQRSDYDVLQRSSRFYLTNEGWAQSQNNNKLQSATGTVVAEERGYETFKRVDEFECAEARVWWSQRKPVWNMIQDEWHRLLAERTDINIRPTVAGRPLISALGNWSEKNLNAAPTPALSSELSELIGNYLQ